MNGGPDELIDDRELQRFDDDRFRHQDVAEQLASLAATAQTPANIALYGAWGSGKSGIGNLLRERFSSGSSDPAVSSVVFARFDAFKYSEVPLRRHFLSQLADRLLSEDEAARLRERLYGSEKSTKVTFATPDLMRALGAFVLLLVVGFGIAAVAALVAAGLVSWLASPGAETMGDRFLSYFGGVVAFSFAPAAVIGGLFAIAGKSLPIERTVEAPSTDEQFEREFQVLLRAALKRHGAQRLVVFVDELDRCPSHRVVDVLDTVRTFLDVPDTVFIIAADQHVIEQALAERVQQTTPSDLSNPYYSTGSAYLDKIFHYQMSLPVLLPQRVTKYAVELVEGRPGLWSDPRIDVPWVVSVLIPTHVRSPRRVKTLLNNYVLAFRLARRRFEGGQLSSDPADRALELAKLVCLRTEFPGFARELPLSRRLPELFLMAMEAPRGDAPGGVSQQVWEIASALAEGRIEVDEMLDSDEDAPVDAPRRRDQSADSAAALRAQLHDYLVKTRHIDSPGLDLIFLEGQGYIHGLDESLAEEVEDSAVGGRVEELVTLVDRQDQSTQTRIVNLLSQRAREAFPGIEGRNLVSGLLAVVASRSDEVLTPCADTAFDALSAQTQMAQLGNDDLAGALRLGLRSDRAGAQALVAHVLNESAVIEDPGMGVAVLNSADHLVARGQDLSSVVARWILDGDVCLDAASALASQTEHSEELLSQSLAEIVRELDAAGPTEAPTVEVDEAAEDRRDVESLVLVLESVIERLAALDRGDLAQWLMVAALSSETDAFWFVAGESLDRVDSVTLVPLVEAICQRAAQVETAVIAEWLPHVPDGLATEQVHQAMDAVTSSLWQQRSTLGPSFDAHVDEVVEALRHTARLAPASGGNDLVPAVEADLGVAPTDPPSAAASQTQWWYARRFVDEGLLPVRPVADAIASRVGTTATTSVPPPSLDESLLSFVEDWSLWCAQRAAPGLAETLAEQVNASPFLPAPRRQILAVRVAAMAALSQPPDEAPLACPYNADQVRQLIDEHLDLFGVAASDWLRAFAGEADVLFSVVEPYLRNGSYRQIAAGALASAVSDIAAKFNPEERLRLASLEIESSSSGQMSTAFLEDVRFPEADESAAADLLLTAYEATATNNDRRRDLLDAWKLLPTPAKAVRNRLIDGVLLPTVEAGGKEGLSLLLARPDLWRDPDDRRRAIKGAFRRTVGSNGEKDRMERLLKEYGVVRTKQKGPLGILGSEELDED